VIKCIKIRWAGHVARMGSRDVYTGFWWGQLSEREHLGNPGVDDMIILNGSSGSRNWGYGLDRSGSG